MNINMYGCGPMSLNCRQGCQLADLTAIYLNRCYYPISSGFTNPYILILIECIAHTDTLSALRNAFKFRCICCSPFHHGTSFREKC